MTQHEANVSLRLLYLCYFKIIFKLNRLFIALCAFIIISAQARPAELKDKFKFNCFIRSLKTLDMIDPYYPEYVIGGYTGNCEKLIVDEKNTVYTNFAAALGSFFFLEYKQCIVEDLKARHFAENAMKHAVLLNSETMSAEEIALQVNAIFQSNKIIVEDSTRHCVFRDIFGKLFDRLIKNDKTADYCLRKYAVDSHLVDAEVYDVSLSPGDTDVQNSDCKVQVEITKLEHLQTFEQTLDNKAREEIKSDCAKERLLHSGLADKMIKVTLLNELNITESQKELERKLFADFFGDLVMSMVYCK